MNGSFRVAVVTTALSLPTASSFATGLSSASQAKLITKVEGYGLIGERFAPAAIARHRHRRASPIRGEPPPFPPPLAAEGRAGAAATA
jgi:hypothetical protein